MSEPVVHPSASTATAARDQLGDTLSGQYHVEARRGMKPRALEASVHWSSDKATRTPPST